MNNSSQIKNKRYNDDKKYQFVVFEPLVYYFEETIGFYEVRLS